MAISAVIGVAAGFYLGRKSAKQPDEARQNTSPPLPQAHQGFRSRLLSKVGQYLDAKIAEHHAGSKLAEHHPGSKLADGLRKLFSHSDSEKEAVPDIAAQMKERFAGLEKRMSNQLLKMFESLLHPEPSATRDGGAGHDSDTESLYGSVTGDFDTHRSRA